LGFASTLEDILKRLEDSNFCDREVEAQLKALLVAPVDHRPSKKQIVIAHQVRTLLSYVAKLNERMEALSTELRQTQADLAAERLHVTQLRKRGVAEAATEDAIENRRLRAEIEAKDQELNELRIELMKKVVGE